MENGKRIMEEVEMLWRGETYKVWVMEDVREWLPNFMIDRVENVIVDDGTEKMVDSPNGNDELQVSPELPSNGSNP